MSTSIRVTAARWAVVCAIGALLTLACGKDPQREAAPAWPDAAADAQAGPAVVVDGGSSELRARDAFVAPSPPPRNGPWASWRANDVGVLASPGKVWSEVSTMRIESAGADIGGVADSFTFVSRKVSGDFEIVARVLSLQMASPDSTVGLMARASDAEPGAANVFLGVLADRMKGGVLLARASAGAAATTAVSDVGIRDGAWLRLTRTGRTVTAYRSAGRLTWTKIGSVQIDLPPWVSVGVAVASRNPNRATVTELTGLRVHNLDAGPATRGWVMDQLGAAGGGAATYDSQGLKVHALGEPLSLLQDAGLFLYKEAVGEQTLTVKVGAFTHPEAAARVGLMLREGPSVHLTMSRSTPAIALVVTPGMGVQLQSRTLPNMMASVVPVVGVAAPVWLRLTRSELPGQPAQSRVTGSYSTDGLTWTSLGSTLLSLPEPFLIGAYASSNGSGTPVTATLTDLSLVQPAPVPASPADAGDAGAADGGL